MKIDAGDILTAEAAFITSGGAQVLIIIIKLEFLDDFIPQAIEIYIIDTKVLIAKLLFLKLEVLIFPFVTKPKDLIFDQKKSWYLLEIFDNFTDMIEACLILIQANDLEPNFSAGDEILIHDFDGFESNHKSFFPVGLWLFFINNIFYVQIQIIIEISLQAQDQAS